MQHHCHSLKSYHEFLGNHQIHPHVPLKHTHTHTHTHTHMYDAHVHVHVDVCVPLHNLGHSLTSASLLQLSILWCSFLHGSLLNEGTCQLCVLSTDLMGSLLYEGLQLLCLGLMGEGGERVREKEKLIIKSSKCSIVKGNLCTCICLQQSYLHNTHFLRINS